MVVSPIVFYENIYYKCILTDKILDRHSFFFRRQDLCAIPWHDDEVWTKQESTRNKKEASANNSSKQTRKTGHFHYHCLSPTKKQLVKKHHHNLNIRFAHIAIASTPKLFKQTGVYPSFEQQTSLTATSRLEDNTMKSWSLFSLCFA